MLITTPQATIYAYTGGKAFDPTRPTVVFIHGVLNDHSVWILQSRYLAHHGYNVLAIDLPGHCKSTGEPPATVEAAAQAVIAMLDALQIDRASIVGHSWGSLITLEISRQAPERVNHVVLVGTAFPMKVSPALIENSLNNPMQALRMINVFSRATLCAPPSVMGPGTWVFGAGMALGKRVLASNPDVNLFHRGFVACDSYEHGEKAAQKLSCPALFVLGNADQMTPAKAAQSLVKLAKATGQPVEVVHLDVGHHQMSEAPDGTLRALFGFLQRHPSAAQAVAAAAE